MDTRQLAAFVAVVEKKSFSQAAERLGVTQPAVSLQIQALEKRLGVQLVDRSGRRVEPTEAGQRLYRNAQRVLAAEQQLSTSSPRASAIAGRLRARRIDRPRRIRRARSCSASLRARIRS